MNRILRLWACFMVMTLFCTPVVYAAKSPTDIIDITDKPATDKNGNQDLVDKNGRKVKVTLVKTGKSHLSGKETKANNSIKNNEELVKILKKLGISTKGKKFELIGTRKLLLIYTDDGKKVTNKNYDGWPLKITINVTGLKKGDKAYILLYRNGKWVNVTQEVRDGSIVGLFDSLGLIAIVREKSDADGNVSINDVSSVKSRKSPKTGEEFYR